MRPDRETTCDWNCTKPFPHDGPCGVVASGWCVRVSVFDDLVVSISERELAGRDISESDADLIRDCARHLLSFVGEKKPQGDYDAVEMACKGCFGPCGRCHEQPPSVNAVDPQAQHRESRERAKEDPS